MCVDLIVSIEKKFDFLSREFFVSDGPFFWREKKKKKKRKILLFLVVVVIERYLRTKVCADYDTHREREREFERD